MSPLHPTVIATVIMWMTIVALLALMSVIVAVQARRRGYSLLVWLIGGLLGNPIFLLVLLGAMPDFARKRLRREERADVEERLRRKVRVVEEEAGEVLAGPSAGPGAVRPAVERSLGDQPTRLPERSLGDEETRL
jgi:hypothetical protein